jgi:putative ABC transport system permease protein
VGEVRVDAAADVDEELRYHLDRAVAESMEAGVDRDEAERRARRRFGDVDAYRRALEMIGQGTATRKHRSEIMGIIWRNVAMALRSLRRAPGFAFAVTTILALGIGANAVMFGVVDRLLLSPPEHVRDPDSVRLIYLRRADDPSGEPQVNRTITFPDYADLLHVAGFSAVAAYSDARATFGRGEGAQQVRVIEASASLFPLLGVRPEIGRFYGPEEDRPGVGLTAVLSHEFWERRFGGDRAVLGKVIDVGDGTYTVVGVAPAGFTGAELSAVDVWLPLEPAHEIDAGGTAWVDNRNWWWLHAVARLAPGVSAAAAGSEATAAHRAGRRDMIAQGRYSAGAEILASPIIAARGPNPSAESQVARWLAAVSLIVLLIACFNVANLLLARAARARREVAVRIALGVSRGRLLGELTTESVVLAVLGAGAALVFARLGGSAIHRALLPGVAFDDGLGGRLLAFTGVLAAVSALLAGVIPALDAGHSDVAGALKAGGHRAGRARSRARDALLVGQAALSVILLVGAGLFTRSLGRARALDLGFDAEHVDVVRLQWNETLPTEVRAQIYADALEHVRRLPGVRAAALSYTEPFASSVSIGRPRVPGLDSVPRPSSGGPYANRVTSGYFETMGLAILQGRGFESRDDAPDAPPVAVVSEVMARGIWPDGNALGSCMMFGKPEDAPPCTTVVGIVENHRREDLVEDQPNWLYYLNQHHPAFEGPSQAIMVGTRARPEAVSRAIRAELGALSGEIRFVSTHPLEDNIAPQLRSWSLGASMFTAFGLLALVVAAWGLYSVLAFEVSLRRRELGIRGALGAGAPGLVGLVLRHALVLVSAGVVTGLLITFAGARFVEPLLFRVSPYDPLVYLGVTGALLVTAVIAGTLPAWRATLVDPLEALQTE